jgi:hypothetical protein
VVLMVWLIPKVWRMIRRLPARITGWFDVSSQRPTP